MLRVEGRGRGAESQCDNSVVYTGGGGELQRGPPDIRKESWEREAESGAEEEQHRLT